MTTQPFERFRPYVLSLLRIVSAFTFALHGLTLEFGLFGGMDQHGAVPAPFTVLWVAGILETWGGLLLGLGLFTRPVAFLLCGQMAAAYFTAHAPQGFWPVLNGGELSVLYCFLFLYFCVAGGGSYSLDALLAARKH
ncbi:MAG TPA: DoxX family protein [Bryobacteraceae bacterium]|nr:DoxX family protein [Bryobacteraceae bacterium]